MTEAAHFIWYVADQAHSTAFYQATLNATPRLHVPGMTEFVLPGGAILGLMPEAGIERLLGASTVRPSAARGIPRAELYLLVQDPGTWHARALAAGGRELSALQPRAWGHTAAYAQDPDGHVLAFATVTATHAVAS